MKKFLPVLSIALLLFGCQKSEQSKPSKETKYNVSFKMDDFSQIVVPMADKKSTAFGDTLKNYVTNLYFKLYDETGTLIKSNEQLSSSATFGTFTEQLAQGEYTAFFVATTGALSFSGTQYTTSVYFPTSNTFWNDTYAITYAFSVNSTPLTSLIKMGRAIGAIEVNIEDVIPSNISKVTLTYTKDSPKLRLSGNADGIYGSTTKEFTLTSADYNIQNKKFLMHVGNVFGVPSTVVIKAYDTNGKLSTEKTVSNVIAYQNKKTVLTGQAFPSQNSTFKITVDPTWGTAPNTIKF